MYSMKRSSARIDRGVLDELDQFVIVDAANHDRIQLELGGTGGFVRCGEHAACGIDASAHRREAVESRESQEAIRSQRVEAHGQAFQPRRPQCVDVVCQQDAVGREREILQAFFRREQPHERGEIAPQQRLAARQPHLVDTERDEDIHERADFLEVEDVLARQPGVSSSGMQYSQRKLQRSVTERRRFRSGRFRASST